MYNRFNSVMRSTYAYKYSMTVYAHKTMRLAQLITEHIHI
jgi:hypothetical protein